ncbi:FAD dependent oxidoreductase [Infundibulicybe gibba]|nr:FAD dependent oxidoreductase [Infundibulicybe gibba]
MVSGLIKKIRRLLIRVLVRALLLFVPPLRRLAARARQSPGLPHPRPTKPHWAVPPSGAGEEQKSPPEYADVVIIGSGITGASVARRLLDQTGGGIRVVMLEARGVCSGATGRNGGHISPVLYPEYESLKNAYGGASASKIIRLRTSHLDELLGVAVEEDLVERSQCREVRTFDVYHSRALFEEMKRRFEVYREDMPDEGDEYQVLEGEAVEALGLSAKTFGVFARRGGAIHPYRFVTGILERLLKVHTKTFSLHIHTPCTSIGLPADENTGLYEVITSRGTIRTRHIMHATNGWASHLLPGMRTKIVPARGVMTARAPLAHIDTSWAGERTFVLYPKRGDHHFDYLTQQPPARNGKHPAFPSNGEMMFGGGFARDGSYITETGVADDSAWKPSIAKHLCSALGPYFRSGHGKPTPSAAPDAEIHTWSGILGISADGCPWVGRVPRAIAHVGRTIATGTGEQAPPAPPRLAAPGEWIAAGYSGEGMVHAWRCGQALADMVLGADVQPEWFPGEVFGVTRERWERASVEGMVEAFMGV